MCVRCSNLFRDLNEEYLRFTADTKYILGAAISVNFSLLVKNTRLGDVYGKKHYVLNSIREISGAIIHIYPRPTSENEENLISLFGEISHINLIREKRSGKSKGLAFLAYEDRRISTLASDNLDGFMLLGSNIKVNHSRKYLRREEETMAEKHCSQSVHNRKSS
ncbi:unnamed protein product [Arabis nemorensis]|uniref:RRM domain-containing protein n=1 Tax=Arabis nemorensis TaxID=586526 RepID=A0A565APJ7_9BRAS|nr:unnamed protein product [Arabis nemorensis]